jgi:8-oxo-dGTP diphosphatase
MQQVTAAILMRDERLLLAKRATNSALAGLWELPGGKVEAGETSEECLVREMREELGVAIKVGELFATSEYEYDHGSFEVLAFFAELVEGDLTARVHETFAWFSRTDLARIELAPADVPIVDRLSAEVM